MILKDKMPVVIVGQVGRNNFKAEVYPRARLIVCFREPFGEPLPNIDTEERARIIAEQLFVRHWTIVIFRFWLYVEVQTCFREIRFSKITGLTWSRRKDLANYKVLTPKEANRIEPFIQSLREQFEIHKESQKPEWVKKLERSENPPPNL
jgi:hypothetical protein